MMTAITVSIIPAYAIYAYVTTKGETERGTLACDRHFVQGLAGGIPDHHFINFINSDFPTSFFY